MSKGAPHISGATIGTGQCTLSLGEDAQRRGREIQDLVEAAVRELPTEKAVRELARLARDYAEVVLRTPAFWEGTEILVRRNDQGALARIYGTPHRGRPLSHPLLAVDLIEKTMAEEGIDSVSKAAALVAEKYRPILAKSAEALRNDHSRYLEDYRRYRGGHCVPAERLTTERCTIGKPTK